jgi:aquaporin Z
VGIALAQGLVFAVVLVVTMHVSGGFANPALTIMLWVFNRMQTVRAAWLVGAQILGAVLAGVVVRCTFDGRVLQDARLGTPHLNRLVYGEGVGWESLLAGALVEFILTFFLVFAIFGAIRSKAQWQQMDEGAVGDDDPYRTIDTRLAALTAGFTLTACVLFAYPLTGAAVNPARWFGPALWEFALLRAPSTSQSAFADMFVYIAGPIAGALCAGLLFFKLMPVTAAERAAHHEEVARKRAETHISAKK